MRTVRRVGRKRNRSTGVVEMPVGGLSAVEMRVALIQALIPLGLEAVNDALQAEVEALAGARYARDGARHVRWGKQKGSVYVADQKLPVEVPRVRDPERQVEVPLETYQRLQTPRGLDAGVLKRILGGLACGEYEACAEAVPEAFGISRSTVSRRFVQASARQLETLQARSLAGEQWVALLVDGKVFAEDSLVIALGVTITGEKRVLGLVQTATENRRVCAAFLRSLVERGFDASEGVLVVLDGAKGLRAAVTDVFGAAAQVQRCQWHKRENVVAHLPKSQQSQWRRKLQRAYQHKSYATARTALKRVESELARLNASAAASLAEGLEDTLTVHRLGLFAELGISFKTTNALESIMAQIEHRTAKIDHWRTSDQKQRWCAASLLAIEPRLRKVKGHNHLPRLARVLRASFNRHQDAA